MNKGSMKGHLKGKLHETNFDTGETSSETVSHLEKLTQKIYWPDQEEILKFNPVIFWQLLPIAESYKFEF